MRASQLLLGILIAIACHCAVAAPFCAVYGWGTQCVYPDLNSCQASVGDATECVVNEAEVRRPEGSEKYCVVSPFAATLCVYEDEDACRQAARANGGMCMMRLD